jgi:uncharacterized protein (TIGR02466 family)
MTSHIIPLFSTPLYKNIIQEDSIALDFIKNILYKSCNNSGNVSTDYFILNRPELYNIKKQVIHNIYNFLNYQLNFNEEFIIQNSWIIRHKKGDFSPKHMHTNCLFSGVVYLQVSDNSGDIIFTDGNSSSLYPNEISLEVSKYNLYNARSWTIKPKSNDILIFPSHLNHEVTINNSDIDRYVLAFNTFPTGILGKNSIAELRLL